MGRKAPETARKASKVSTKDITRKPLPGSLPQDDSDLEKEVEVAAKDLDHSSDTVIHTPMRRRSSVFPGQDILNMDLINQANVERQRGAIHQNTDSSGSSSRGAETPDAQQADPTRPVSFLGVRSHEEDDPRGASLKEEGASTSTSQPQYASTPTITTIGSDRATWGSETTETGIATRVTGYSPSRHDLTLSVMPNDEHPNATATRGVTSVRLLETTRRRLANLAPAAYRRSQRTARFMPQRVPRQTTSEEQSLRQAQDAQEAALLASTFLPKTVHEPPLTQLLRDDAGDIGVRSGKKLYSHSCLRSAAHRTLQILAWLCVVLRQMAARYWQAIAPCFDSRSGIRRRYARHETTWNDVFIVALLYLALLVLVSVGIRVGRGLVWLWPYIEVGLGFRHTL